MSTHDEHDFLRYRDRGDAEALARVFDALAPKLLLLAQHLTRDGAQAEDLVQSTFLQAMRSARSYERERPLLGWMAGILAHRAADERRRARVRATEPVGAELAGGADPLAEAVDRETLERIGAAIDGLEGPQREVLVLRAIHGLAPLEIAHALGRAPGTVRMQLARARERLKERLPSSLSLPALFLRDEGHGLAAVRAEILREATAVGVAAGAGGGWAAQGWFAAALLGTGLAGFLWWRAQAEELPREADVVAAGAPASPALVGEPGVAAGLELAEESSSATAARQPIAGVVEESRVGAAATSGALVKGIVLALDRSPVASARVFAVEGGAMGLGRELGVSDGRGHFEVVAPAGTLLAACKDGFQPSGGSKGRVRSRPDEELVAVLVMGADGHALSGCVVDRRGAPVASPLVAVAVDEDARKQREGMPRARESGGRKPLDREAFVLQGDAMGCFSTASAPAGRALVLARSSNPESGLVGWTFADVRAAGHDRCEITLAEGAAIAGRVLDENGRAVAGLAVHAEWKGHAELGAVDDDGWGPLFSDRGATTGADGGFLLNGLLPGEHEVRVIIGGKELGAELFTLEPGEERRWDVDVAATVPLAVRVVGPKEEPLAGWGLSWGTGDDLDYGLSRELDMPVTLDADGRYRIEGMELIEHVFAVFSPASKERARFARLPCAIRHGVLPSSGELVVRVSADEWPSAGFTGTWVDARGEACAGFEIVVQRAGWDEDGSSIATDTSGRFALGDLAPGEYVVLADEDAVYPRDTQLARCTLGPGETRDLGTLSLGDPTRLVVALRDEGGEPLEGARVQMFDAAFERYLGGFLSWSREERIFRSDPVLPGAVLVSVSAPGCAQIWQRVELEPVPENRVELVARPGLPVEFVVDFPLREEGALGARERPGVLQILFRGPDGAPVLWQIIEAPFEDPAGRRLRFTLPLAAGPYRGVFEERSTARVGHRARSSAELDFTVPAEGTREPIQVVIR